MKFLPILFLLLSFGPNLLRADLLHQAAVRAGLQEFDQIESLAFTFKLEVPGRQITRSWFWNPGSAQVTRTLPDGQQLTFRRHAIGSEEERIAESQFINDLYWLIFPIAAIWDGQATVTDQGSDAMPISGSPGRRLEVAYPPDGSGFTPGDTYVLFLDSENLVREWIFIRGEQERPVTFEGYQQFGPLHIATLHRGPDPSFKLTFTDISVQLR